jgi:hypothetical protein
MSGSTIYVNDPTYIKASYTLSEIVAGHTGSYRAVSGAIGVFVHELEYLFNVNNMR